MIKYRIMMNIAAVIFFSNCLVSINTNDIAYRLGTNEEIRIWYNAQSGMVPELNKVWKNNGMSAEERAKKAFEIRHLARLKARSVMKDNKEVRELQKRDKEKYGNPDGPTFESLVKKAKDSGLDGDEVYESIIDSSSRTDETYNRKNGIYH